eukprot:gene5104-222_t
MVAPKDGKGSLNHGIGLSLVATAFAHPLAYVKVLVQVGYEPLPPKKGKTFFGKDVLHLPGFFDYARYIKNDDGFSGLYRGLVPRVLHNFVSSSVTNAVCSRFQSAEEQSSDSEETDEEYEPPAIKTQSEFLIETLQLSIGKAAGVVISYPLHLISVRTMVQFVGKETQYNNLFSSVREIYQEEGIGGFFSGLVPQLLGEMLSFWVFRTLTYFIETYFGIDEYVASLLTFPFFLVTNMMAVNNSRLAAGNPPNMPIFNNWIDCWVYLSKEKLLRRGDSIIRRTMPIRPNAALQLAIAK